MSQLRPDPALIAVSPPVACRQHELLFRALEQLYLVRFEPVDGPNSRSCVGMIVVGPDPLTLIQPGPVAHWFAAMGDSAGEMAGAGDVRFGTDPALNSLFRGKCFREDSRIPFCPLAATGPDRVLASHSGRPVWTKRHLGPGVLDLVASDLPRLNSGENLASFFQRGRFIQLLPLLHWLEEVTSGLGWKRPPLRAAFMFDDPNLRWPSYGFINYRRLIEHARAHGYHASMATIPIDTWRVDPRAAVLFREHPGELSLLIHGNNHTLRELAGEYPGPVRRAFVAQAIARVEKLECVSRVPVARVMAAPHGACNEAMAGSLAAGGFESACISRGSLLRHNPKARWNAAFGLRLAEILGETLPVFPRFALRQDCELEVTMAAFLGQPIIPMGHHQDVRGGLELLANVAGMINRLGPVEWCDLQRISRSNFLSRIQGRTLFLRMFARTVEMDVPGEVDQINIELPWQGQTLFPEDIVATSCSGELLWRGPAAEAGFEVGAGTRGRMVIRALPRGTALTQTRLPSFKLWPAVRRVLAEGRDRMLPLLPNR